jgi:hypothetical protein
MSTESDPRREIDRWRERYRAFVEAAKDPTQTPELDVLDLLGARGQSISTTGPGIDPESAKDGWSINNAAVRAAYDTDDGPFPEIVSEQIGQEDHLRLIEPLLAKLAMRKAPEAIGPIGRAFDQLREPVRTVAITNLYWNLGAEETARVFGISAEMVTLLSDLALDIVESHLIFE